MLPPLKPGAAIEAAIREDWGRTLAVLTKQFGDIQLAEDSLQDAVEAALKTWPEKGLPASPAAWLITAARRKAIDHLRRKQTFHSKQADIAYLKEIIQTPEETDLDALPDKRLEMIFTCCHPAIAEKSQVALTLRTLGGLSTDDIARAFLDKPSAMAQRLVRAKHKIKQAKIPYEIPDKLALPARLKGVLGVIYLIFNEGYSASSGTALTRTDLSAEATRLARIIKTLMPDEPEVSGLLALMLLHDSRRRARTGNGGEMVALEFQNRAVWDRAKIKEGRALIRQTLQRQAPQAVGPYQLQAAISALHTEAKTWADTDWPQIAALYNLLYTLQPSPVILINQALAVSYAQSPQAGLQILARLETRPALERYQPLFAAKADLLSRAGQTAAAQAALIAAISLTDNLVERKFLESKLNNPSL